MADHWLGGGPTAQIGPHAEAIPQPPDRSGQIRQLTRTAVRIGINGALIFDNSLRYLLERFFDHDFIVVGKCDHRLGDGLQRLNPVHVDHQHRIIESCYFNHLDTTLV